tara:strand:- start:979 stop:1302 length:324 start_codon:yes stop_codon:yes gene_type:complete
MSDLIFLRPDGSKEEMDIKDADKISVGEAMASMKRNVDKMLDDDPSLKNHVETARENSIKTLETKFRERLRDFRSRAIHLMEEEEDWDIYGDEVLKRLRVKIEGKHD